MFSGAFTAIVTPFKNDQIDEDRLRKLIEYQINQGIQGIVPCGTTGESPTLSHKEHDRVISITVETVNKRVPVLAGTGSNSTDEAIRLTKHAQQNGADGALLITPYYNKPTQSGLIQHFEKISAKTSIPMVLYNVPSRTGVNLLPETAVALSKNEQYWGIKEASGSLDQASFIISNSRLKVISGDDGLTFPLLSIGAKGVISVASNIIPKQMAEMTRMAMSDQMSDFIKAREMHLKLFSLFKNLFLETSPSPIKYIMAQLNMIQDEVRLPLVQVNESTQKILDQTIEELSLHSMMSAYHQ